MMREGMGLHRGLRLDNGLPVKGFLVKRPSAVYIGSHSPWYIEVPPSNPDDSGATYNVDPESVGQYTGVRARRGKRIFEKQSCRVRVGGELHVGEVIFDPQVAIFVVYIENYPRVPLLTFTKEDGRQTWIEILDICDGGSSSEPGEVIRLKFVFPCAKCGKHEEVAGFVDGEPWCEACLNAALE